MNWREIAAWTLAEELEVIRAKTEARRFRRNSDVTWQGIYDPHAATELARLIYNRMTKKPTPRAA